jgi:O-antigen/teichoic acid export membrane protein
VLLLVAGDGLSVGLGLAGLISGGALAAVIAMHAVSSGEAVAVSREQEHAVVGFGRRLTGAVLPSMLNPRVDQLATSLVLAPAVLGVYSVGAAISSVVLILGVSIEQVLFPRLVVSGVPTRRLLSWAVLATAATAVVCVALWAVAPTLVEMLYGAPYLGATEPLPLLLAAAGIRVGTAVLSAGSKARDDLTGLTVANVSGLVVGVVSFAALNDQGMKGIAMAALLGAASTAMILVWSLGRDCANA